MLSSTKYCRVKTHSKDDNNIKVDETCVEVLSAVTGKYVPWTLNRTFDCNESQRAVWLQLEKRIDSFLRQKTRKLTFLAAGCSGSGKSYTIFGNTFYSERGLLQRFLEQQFPAVNAVEPLLENKKKKRKGKKSNNIAVERERLRPPVSTKTVDIKMYLVHMETIVDLFSPGHMYAHFENVFTSPTLGPVIMGLKTVHAESIGEAMVAIGLGIRACSVILANNSNFISSSHIFVSCDIICTESNTVRCVEFVELASVFVESNNNGDVAVAPKGFGATDAAVASTASPADTSVRYGSDAFIGQSVAQWSIFHLQNVVCKKFTAEESTAEDLRRLCVHDEPIVDKTAWMTFGKSLMLYLLQDVLLKQCNSILLACLRSEIGCFAENAACLDFVTKFEEFQDKFAALSSTGSLSPNSRTTKTYNHQTAPAPPLEVEYVVRDMDRDSSAVNPKQVLISLGMEINTLKSQILEDHKGLDGMIEEQKKASKLSSSFGVKATSQESEKRVALLDSYRDRMELSLRKLSHLLRYAQRLVSFFPVLGDHYATLGFGDFDLKQAASKDHNKVVLNVLGDWLAQHGLVVGVVEDEPPEDNEAAGAANPSGGGTSSRSSRSSTKCADSGESFAHGSGEAPDWVKQSDKDYPLYLDIPWSTEVGPSLDPYIRYLSPNNLCEQFHRVPLLRGFGVVRFSKLPILEITTQEMTIEEADIALLPILPQKKRQDSLTPSEDSQANSKTSGMTGATKPVGATALPQVVSSMMSRRGSSATVTAMQLRQRTLRREEQQFQQQLGLLAKKHIIPHSTERVPSRPASPTIHSRPGTSNTRASDKDAADSEANAATVDGFYTIPMHSGGGSSTADGGSSNGSGCCVDAELMGDLSVAAVIVQRFDDIVLIPTRMHVLGTVGILPTAYHPILSVNGIPVIESDDADRVQEIPLYDQDIVQIGCSKFMKICIPRKPFGKDTARRSSVSTIASIAAAAARAQRAVETQHEFKLIHEAGLTEWERALLEVNAHLLKHVVIFDYLRHRREVAHMTGVNREMNAIAKLKQRNALALMKDFDPSLEEIDVFFDNISYFDRCKICELISHVKYSELTAKSLKKYVKFSCIMRLAPARMREEDTTEDVHNNSQFVKSVSRKALLVDASGKLIKTNDSDGNNTNANGSRSANAQGVGESKSKTEEDLGSVHSLTENEKPTEKQPPAHPSAVTEFIPLDLLLSCTSYAEMISILCYEVADHDKEDNEDVDEEQGNNNNNAAAVNEPRSAITIIPGTGTASTVSTTATAILERSGGNIKDHDGKEKKKKPKGEKEYDDDDDESGNIRMAVDVLKKAHNNASTSSSWLWKAYVFKQRSAVLLDMYSEFASDNVCRRDIIDLNGMYPQERDPLHPVQMKDELVGVAFLRVDSLVYLIDKQETLAIVGYSGNTVGQLKVGIRCWIDTVEPIPAYITADIPAELHQYMGRKLIVNIYIEYIAGLREALCSDCYVFFKFMRMLSSFYTPRFEGCDQTPYFDHTIQIEEIITPALIDFLSTGCVEFEVFATKRPSILSLLNKEDASMRDRDLRGHVVKRYRPNGFLAPNGGAFPFHVGELAYIYAYKSIIELFLQKKKEKEEEEAKAKALEYEVALAAAAASASSSSSSKKDGAEHEGSIKGGPFVTQGGSAAAASKKVPAKVDLKTQNQTLQLAVEKLSSDLQINARQLERSVNQVETLSADKQALENKNRELSEAYAKKVAELESYRLQRSNTHNSNDTSSATSRGGGGGGGGFMRTLSRKFSFKNSSAPVAPGLGGSTNNSSSNINNNNNNKRVTDALNSDDEESDSHSGTHSLASGSGAAAGKQQQQQQQQQPAAAKNGGKKGWFGK